MKFDYELFCGYGGDPKAEPVVAVAAGVTPLEIGVTRSVAIGKGDVAGGGGCS